ncbi:sensor histidine kinase [Streptomyces sp. SID5474]|nr:sensor histidine kinase [Embleya scabrispora]MYS83911.1 sensor histidine kinase [Streptomyces sp. SID5474]
MVDAILAVALAAGGCVAGQQFHPEGWVRFDATAYLLTCALSLPLALRRRAPVPVLIASGSMYVVYLAVGYQPSLNFWAPVIALVTLAGQRPPRSAAMGAVFVAAVVAFSGIRGRLGPALVLAQAVLVPVVAVVIGDGVRRLAQRNRQLILLTARLEREQEERARRAIVNERVRIARELHDVVAHHMSVITVQVGLASYVFDSDPRAARAALDVIGDVGRDALDEMRRLLSLLRVDFDEDGGSGGAEGRRADAVDGAADPMPGLDRLADLAERMSAVGVTVDLTTEGVPRHLAPGLELCVYRIVQEALTNVVKHAGTPRADVRIRHLSDRLCVSIANDGPRGAASRPRVGPGTGHGLIGMRERAKILGGTLSAGERPEGGFRVHLTLPLDTAPPPGG